MMKTLFLSWTMSMLFLQILLSHQAVAALSPTEPEDSHSATYVYSKDHLPAPLQPTQMTHGGAPTTRKLPSYLFTTGNIFADSSEFTAQATDPSVKVYFDDNEFYAMACAIVLDRFSDTPSAEGLYNSPSFTEKFDTKGIQYVADPDTNQVDASGNLLCTSTARPDAPCSGFRRTMILPRTINTNGAAPDGFHMEITGPCVDSLNVAVVTQSGTTVVPVECDGLQASKGFGLYSSETIQSVTVSANYDNYAIAAVGMAATCSSTSPSRSPSIAPSPLPTVLDFVAPSAPPSPLDQTFPSAPPSQFDQVSPSAAPSGETSRAPIVVRMRSSKRGNKRNNMKNGMGMTMNMGGGRPPMGMRDKGPGDSFTMKKAPKI
jgi:hypothetical protein